MSKTKPKKLMFSDLPFRVVVHGGDAGTVAALALADLPAEAFSTQPTGEPVAGEGVGDD